MVGPLANSCNAAVSDLGASRRASHNLHVNLTIVNVRLIARLNVHAIRYTALIRAMAVFSPVLHYADNDEELHPQHKENDIG